MGNISKSIVIILAMFAFACNYEPTGVYESDIKPVTAEPVVKLDSLLRTDTLYLVTDEKPALTFESDEKKIANAHIKIDNRSYYPYAQSSSKVTFSTYNWGLPAGNYTLELEIKFNSGSGSLADKMGQEYISYKKSWVLKVIDAAGISPAILNITPENGTLRLDIDAGIEPGSISYLVVKKKIKHLEMTVADIKPQTRQLSIYDSTYMGEEAVYYTFIRLAGSQYGTYKSDEAAKPQELPQMQAVTLDGKDGLISWVKTKYTANVAAYQLVLSSESRTLTENTINDTSYTVKDYTLAKEGQYTLKLIPKKIFTSYGDLDRIKAYTTYGSLSFGTPSGFIASDIRATSKDLIIYQTDNSSTIYLFAPSLGKVTDSITGKNTYMFTVSRNGDYIVTYYNGTIEVLRHPGTVTKTIYQLSSLNVDITEPNSFGVTDNGIYIIGDRPEFTFLDLKTGQKVMDLVKSDILMPVPSADFKYITMYNTSKGFSFWKVNGNKLDLILDKSDSPLILFGYLTNSKVMCKAQGIYQVYDLEDNARLVSEKVIDGNLYRIDYRQPYITIYSSDGQRVDLVNWETGQTEGSVKLGSFSHAIHNKILYTTNGFLYKF